MDAMKNEQNATLMSNGKVLFTGADAIATSAGLYDPDSGKFRSIGGTKELQRSISTATALPNGKVLIVGGSSCATAKGCALASAELYDPATETFAFTGTMNTVRYGHTATMLSNGKVLVTGGIGENGYLTNLSSAELYDPVTGRFTSTGAMSTSRSWHTATLLPSGRVLIAGGFGGADFPAVAELYDPATGKFTKTGSLSGPRMSHTATLLLDGKVLIAGGIGQRSHFATAELYDPATGKFTATGSMATSRTDHTATLLPNGKVLIAGGVNTMPPHVVTILDTAELYDPSTRTFSPAGTMMRRRERHSATLLSNGTVLLAGGDTPPDGRHSSAELYEPAQTVGAGKTNKFDQAARTELLLFSNYHAGDKPAPEWGGWGIGGTTLEKDNAGAEAVGFLITPSSSGRLQRIEIAVHRYSGEGKFVGFLMTDTRGPGKVISQVSFAVPASSDPYEAQHVSADVKDQPLISSSKNYWLVLEATDPVKDYIFWWRVENQPATTIAIRNSRSEPWRMNGAYGAMLRMYGEVAGE
jgi:hypothetical protein